MTHITSYAIHLMSYNCASTCHSTLACVLIRWNKLSVCRMSNFVSQLEMVQLSLDNVVRCSHAEKIFEHIVFERH